ncbi:hypothetical protein [Herbiconiux sp. VKM Ac-2851]|uniref:hypothetical protein n=1 Tax=Herbiconiux sp. VKM Ac-2851 TaxID=2739025 RepID=UPI0015637482|nr:hypothetical protein [Herbiconiux sp. VKM Ac-2851]NQX37166.1 hypothetical protein [Herbiconiux sp. VKM Ac-2851]
MAAAGDLSGGHDLVATKLARLLSVQAEEIVEEIVMTDVHGTPEYTEHLDDQPSSGKPFEPFTDPGQVADADVEQSTSHNLSDAGEPDRDSDARQEEHAHEGHDAE